MFVLHYMDDLPSLPTRGRGAANPLLKPPSGGQSGTGLLFEHWILDPAEWFSKHSPGGAEW